MQHSRFAVAACLCLAATTTLAAEAPPLPTAAKKLSLAEIKQTLDGKTLKYQSYSKPDVKTGVTSFDFKKGVFWGTYEGKKYNPMPLSTSADGYCYDPSCSSGLSLYQDGTRYFEVGANGKVNAILQR